MASDLVICPERVKAQEGAKLERGIAGEKIQAGDSCYVNVTSGRWMHTTAKSLAGSIFRGIAAVSVDQGEMLLCVIKGLINPGIDPNEGPTIQSGEIYAVSPNKRRITCLAEVPVDSYIGLIGLGTREGFIDVLPDASNGILK